MRIRAYVPQHEHRVSPRTVQVLGRWAAIAATAVGVLAPTLNRYEEPTHETRPAAVAMAELPHAQDSRITLGSGVTVENPNAAPSSSNEQHGNEVSEHQPDLPEQERDPNGLRTDVHDNYSVYPASPEPPASDSVH